MAEKDRDSVRGAEGAAAIGRVGRDACDWKDGRDGHELVLAHLDETQVGLTRKADGTARRSDSAPDEETKDIG